MAPGGARRGRAAEARGLERLGLVGEAGPSRGASLLRLLAPVAFLAAVTIAVLLVAARRDSDSEPRRTGPAAGEAVRRAPARFPRRRFVRIRHGDTLGAIARRSGTTVERLLVLNPGVTPTTLRIGQRLRTR
ncbi:MAG: LysM peptidoglycan-binding domain-containing protein [Actinobacteria bacterium]|nr:LysM peptidoglycan-binding domain-containing protein [Actinomycetota bacterium]